MTTYDVHLYCTVRVKVSGIEAESMEAAIEKAESCLPLEELINREVGELHPNEGMIEYVEADEDIHHALVDVEGDEDYAQSRVFANNSDRGWIPDDHGDAPSSQPDDGDSSNTTGERP